MTTEPDQTLVLDGDETHVWGSVVDPVPTVYTSANRGGEVDLPGLRLGLDVAERYARRILAAVAFQRAQISSGPSQSAGGVGPPPAPPMAPGPSTTPPREGGPGAASLGGAR
jgi:hypothetical protein